jgi:peptidoglycan/LPS O-acetylase OafA/YrhL
MQTRTEDNIMDGAPRKHMPYLDGWRGLAIVCLLLGHFLPVRGMNLGGLGVNLFFVLSGLLMGRLLFLDQVPIRTFYRRRIARIFPLAYFFLIAIACWTIWSARAFDWTELAAASVFMNNYIRPDRPVMPFGHFWSLCVEEHSYIMLSLVACGVRAGYFSALRAIAALLLCSIAIGAIYTLTYAGPDLYHERWLRSEISSFGIIVSAFILVLFKGYTGRVSGLVIVGLVVLGLALHWWRVPPFWRTFAGVAALAVAINLLERAPGWIHALLSPAPLRQLGIWSFSIYVWQQPFYVAVHEGKLSVAAGLALSLLAGIVSFYLIEKPAREWLNRRWRGQAKADVAPGLATPAQTRVEAGPR